VGAIENDAVLVGAGAVDALGQAKVNHDDLIKRIQNSAIAAGMPPDIAEGMSEPGRHFENQQGHKRCEFKVKVSSIRSIFSKLFKRGET
jgi:hypothetical protein